MVSLLARRLKQGLLEWMWRGQKTHEQHLREAESTKFRDSLNVGNAERDRILVDCLSLSFGSSALMNNDIINRNYQDLMRVFFGEKKHQGFCFGYSK